MTVPRWSLTSLLRYDLGLAVAAVRTWRGMSQSELGARMGAPRTMISRLELGTRPLFHPRMLDRIAAALDTSPYFLLAVAGFDEQRSSEAQ